MSRNDLPAVKAKLNAHYKGQAYAAEIVTDRSFPDGRAIEVNGKRFRTLSGAAMSIVGHNINGWTFWKERHSNG